MASIVLIFHCDFGINLSSLDLITYAKNRAINQLIEEHAENKFCSD